MSLNEIKELENDISNVTELIINKRSLKDLYESFIYLTIQKSEVHKLIHFCTDDYERKLLFSVIDLINSTLTVADRRIRHLIREKTKNIQRDFEAEQIYLQNELERKTNQAVLFKEFCKELLSGQQYSQINQLAIHCAAMNMEAKDYILEKKFKNLKFK